MFRLKANKMDNFRDAARDAGLFFAPFLHRQGRGVPLAFACDKARKMPEQKFDSLGVKFWASWITAKGTNFMMRPPSIHAAAM